MKTETPVPSAIVRKTESPRPFFSTKGEGAFFTQSPAPVQAFFQPPVQRVAGESESPPRKNPNTTGLPDKLKTGVESLSGIALDDVKVHYNSPQPAQLHAHAYAQGNQIHIAPGQEQHLPHEAWHVVQQKQGRVKPTMQMKGKVNINDDAGLEREAEVMGGKAMQMQSNATPIHHGMPKWGSSNRQAWGGETNDQVAHTQSLRHSRPEGTVFQKAAAAPSSGNAATYDDADLDVTAGAGASASVEVKTTIANKNPASQPTSPINAEYMLQNYDGDYRANGGTTTVDENGDNSTNPYILTKWNAYFNWDLNKGHSLTQTHIIHHALAADANNNDENIAWANAYLNNTAWWPGPALMKPRSVADREHEDRDILNGFPYGTGGKKLGAHLYTSPVNVRPYNGDWYTTNNSIGVATAKVPATDIPIISAATFPHVADIWKLVSGRLCLWYKSVPDYDTGRTYADNIRTNLQTAYDARVNPQHLGEELAGPAWFNGVGTEIANSYARGFRISSYLYRLNLIDSSLFPTLTDVPVGNVVSWTPSALKTEYIPDPAAKGGGMRVNMTYIKAVDAMEDAPNAGDAVDSPILDVEW